MARTLLLAIALALLLTLPGWLESGLNPWNGALGHPRADTWNHVWGYGAVAEALAHGRAPWWTEQLAWPTGGSLWFIDLPMAALLAPFTWLWGPVFSYNLGILLNLVLAGVGARAFARRAGASEESALLAALIYEAQPHLLAQIHNGISETLAVGWMPLAGAAVLRLREESTRKNAVVAGLLWAASVWANPYYGLVTTALVAALAAPRLLRGWQVWLWMTGTGGLAIAPFAFLFSRSLEGEHPLVSRDPEFVYRSLVGHNMVDLLAFFHPGNWYSPDLLKLFDDQLVVVVYLGFGLLALASRGVEEGREWALAALGTFLLALGPFLYFDGQYVMVGEGRYLPLPFLALYDLVPALSRVSHPYRFVVPVCLFLSVLAARGLRRSSGRMVALAGTLVLLEVLVLSPAPFPLPVADATPDPAALALRTAPRPGAVLDLPVSLQMLDRSRYDLGALTHQRPIPYGLNDPTPSVLQQNPLTSLLITLERSPVMTLDPDLSLLDLEMGRRKLAAQGMAYIVVHRESYPPNQLSKILEILELLCGEGEEKGSATVFTVAS